ncbi:MAG: retropepsin-like aspartic protease [Isosphaeraceae bacterium]|jgi:predicted aspartyl protease
MQVIQFDRTQAIPVVDLRIFGPNKHRKVGLVFDTGSAITQVDTEFIERIGYSARDAVHVSGVQGAVGGVQEGYVVRLAKLSVFGIDFQNLPVLVYDFDNFKEQGIDGLLGWDLIKQLHVELVGPGGILKVF